VINLTLREWSALVSAVLVTVATIWYIYLAIRGKIKPVLASWIVLGCTMTLSFATYWTSPKHSIVSNASNAASVVSAMGILITTAWLQRGVVSFSRFQKWCLSIAGLITLFWVILVWGLHRTGIVPNVLTQVLLLVGYLVTAQKLWRATKNTESFFTWWCLVIASAIALYTAIVSKDALAMLYATRATLASATLVWLMYRIERRYGPPVTSVEEAMRYVHEHGSDLL
jgi:hypothetical protein